MKKMKKLMQKIKKHLTRKLDKDDISMQELKELQKKGITILDVRSVQEFQEDHIDGAISMPEYKITKEILNRISPDEEIIVYCSTRAKK